MGHPSLPLALLALPVTQDHTRYAPPSLPAALLLGVYSRQVAGADWSLPMMACSARWRGGNAYREWLKARLIPCHGTLANMTEHLSEEYFTTRENIRDIVSDRGCKG